MNFEIIPTPVFERSLKSLAKRYRSIKDDLKEFAKSLQENPFQGDELTPGVRKIRMAILSILNKIWVIQKKLLTL